ncbi:PREDICTED: DNA (cytosine-5)-methyltransferase 3B-like [Diuraphis noxia]|uniref:DNA (cytosine-5)-methyltransferase 3B-like n=1 Tax=Diuraphis noxia TaxID=143948 RepID=UPI00076368B7|nr:PREDICTED: DNA (cytosine-5)-methyltransferase 3B-like [Diuraphis noxia]
MIIDTEKQHGQVVWAKLSQKSMLWGAIILSVRKLNLAYFEEQPGKTCVWWLSDDSMSQLKNDLIFDFKSKLKIGMKSLNVPRKNSVKQAIQMLSLQLNFVAPRNGIIDWASKNLSFVMNVKRRRKEEFIIPDDILQKIIMANNNIRRCMEENRKKNIKGLRRIKTKKINVSELSKKGNKYCMACRMPSVKPKIEHPIFKGFLCDDCFIKGKDIILSIAKDSANDGCCVCLTQKDTLVLCSFCVRVYCNECLEFYCGQRGLEKILNDNTWTCFACNTIILKTCKLVPRSTKDQLKNKIRKTDIHP